MTDKSPQVVSLPLTWATIKAEFRGPSNRQLRKQIYDSACHGNVISGIAWTACGEASLWEVAAVMRKEFTDLGYHRASVIVRERGAITAYFD